MINSNSHQFLFVSRLRTDSGSEEKIQYWNSKKQKEFALPCTMSVIEEEGVLSFKDMLTGQVVESVTLEQLLTEADGVALKLSPTHEIKIMRPSAIPGAYEDQTQFALGRVQSSALSVFLYEGAGHQLTRFDRVNKEEITDGFKLQVSSDGVMVSPIHAHLMKNGEVLRSPARISFNEFGKTELRVGNQWWKFGYFPAPVILDESEYEILDPAESKQDILFKTFLTASIAMGALMLGWMTWVSPMLADQRPVLETAEIKIDRNNLVAKSIQEEAPKPVAEMTPAAPPVVQPEVKVVAQPVPETPAPKAPAPKAPGPNAPKFAKQKPSSAPIQKIGPTVAMKTPGPGKTGTGTPGTGTGSNALLTRHSKMLQDAFGSVMAMKGSNPSAATPEVAGGISGVNGAALGKGKGSLIPEMVAGLRQ